MHEEAMGRKGVRRQDVMSFRIQLLRCCGERLHTEAHTKHMLRGACEALMLIKFSAFIFWTMAHSSSIGSWTESSLGLTAGIANMLQDICLIWPGAWLAS